jgi:hypothetical protein
LAPAERVATKAPKRDVIPKRHAGRWLLVGVAALIAIWSGLAHIPRSGPWASARSALSPRALSPPLPEVAPDCDPLAAHRDDAPAVAAICKADSQPPEALNAQAAPSLPPPAEAAPELPPSAAVAAEQPASAASAPSLQPLAASAPDLPSSTASAPGLPPPAAATPGRTSPNAAAPGLPPSAASAPDLPPPNAVVPDQSASAASAPEVPSLVAAAPDPPPTAVDPPDAPVAAAPGVTSPPAAASAASAPQPVQARIAFGATFTPRGLSRLRMRDVIDPSGLTKCYQAVLRASGAAKAPFDARLDVEISTGRRITYASLRGPQVPNGLKACVERVALGSRWPSPVSRPLALSSTLTFQAP